MEQVLFHGGGATGVSFGPDLPWNKTSSIGRSSHFGGASADACSAEWKQLAFHLAQGEPLITARFDPWNKLCSKPFAKAE